MDLYEHFAIVAFRRGDREELSKWLKDRNTSRPLSKDLYQLFQELVDGRTGRRRGRPAARDISEQMIIAIRVGMHIRNGLLVKEAIDRVAKDRRRTFSSVEKAHQKFRENTAIFLGPETEPK